MTKLKIKISFIFACVTLISAFALPCLFASAEGTTDFSRSGYPQQTITAETFLTNNMGYKLTEAEQAYLNAHPVFTVKYNTAIPSSTVKVEFDGSKVSVTPIEYSYKTVNGQIVTWKPLSVNGSYLSNGSATIAIGSEDFVTVNYQTVLTVDKTSVNALLNQYYNAAKAQSDRLKAHNKEVADYNAYLAALSEYNDVLLPRYERYLQEFAEWKRKDDPYQAYLAEYAQYLAEKDAYEHYNEAEARAQYEADMQRYQQYKADLTRYEQLLTDYRDSLQSPDLVKFYNQLAILDYIGAECNQRSLRSAIMGNTVTQVLSREEELKLALSMSGLSNDSVSKADRATRNLRDLITKYEECSTDEAKYAFYITCHEQLKENFSNLLRCLDYFYRNGTIHDMIVNNGKDEAYKILLAQLYEISNALDNSLISNYEKKFLIGKPTEGYFDGNYRIGGSTAENILGDCLLPDGNDALPLSDGVPILPKEPQKPTEVTEPKPPHRPQQPIAPMEVASPGPAPVVVMQPQLPQAVSEPAAYLPTEEEVSLQRAFDSGLQPREEVNSDVSVTVSTQIKKYFRNVDYVTVYFYRSETETESYYFAEAERGSFVELPEEIPTANRTGYTCTFDGWIYADGADVDWSNLRKESVLSVYPKFVETPNLYDVVWVIDGVTHMQKAPYGSIPQYDEIPAKQDDADGRKYRFEGWDRPLEPMTEQTVTYTAQFEESALVAWIVENDRIVVPCWKGDVPVYPYDTPAKQPATFYYYTFAGWDKQISPASDDIEYTALFTATVVMKADEHPVRIDYSEGLCTATFAANSQIMIDISQLLNIAAGRNAAITLDVNYGTTVIAFSSANVYDMERIGVQYYTYQRIQTGFREYIYSLYLYDADGEPLDCDIEARVTVSDAMHTSNTKLYCTDNPDVPLRLQIAEGKATFTMTVNLDYFTLTRYNVYVAASCSSIISIDKSSNLTHNELVTITIKDIPAGKNLDRIVAADENGNEMEIVNNSFIVDSGDVTLFAILSDIYYTVTFRSDGKVISTRSYRYGETVEQPPSPIKAPDGEYSYLFTAWDKPITVVTADAEYNAVFAATPLETLSDGSLSKEMKLLISCAAAFFAIVIAVAVAVPLLIRRKRKRIRASQTEQAEQLQSNGEEEKLSPKK